MRVSFVFFVGSFFCASAFAAGLDDASRFVLGGVIDSCSNPDNRGVALQRFVADEKSGKAVLGSAPMPVCSGDQRPWYFLSIIEDAAWLAGHKDKYGSYNHWDIAYAERDKAFLKVFGVPLTKNRAYNPAAVDAIMKVLYVAPSDGRYGASAQLLYDVGFKEMMRETARELGRYTQTKGWMAAKTEKLKKAIAKDPYAVRTLYDAWANELPPPGENGEPGYADGNLVGMLMRRSLDGTLPPLLAAFGKVLKDYDPETFAVWSKGGFGVEDGKSTVDFELDAPPGIGWLGIDVDDGKQSASAPGSARLSPGKHKLTLKLQDAVGVPDVTQTIEAPSAKPVVLKVRDGKARVFVDVENDVEGRYKVAGNDQWVPGVIEVPPGAVELVPGEVTDDCMMMPPQKLTVAADEVKKIKVKPTKATSTLHVDFVGDDGKAKVGFVIVDGKDVGKTGADIKLSTCAKQLQVLIDGKKVHEQALTLAPATTTTLPLGKKTAPPTPPTPPPTPFVSPFTAVAPPVLPSSLASIKLENADGPIDYSVTAERFAARGNTVKVECPAQIKLGKVFGSGPYGVTSSICLAAVHAGLLVRGQAGALQFTIGPPGAVKGSRENSVTSLDGDGQKTFSFVP